MIKTRNNDLENKKDQYRIIVLYDSKFGNTKKVANSLIRGLEAGGNIVDCSSINDFKIGKIESYDVIGIGGPTHNRGMSKEMKSFISKLRKFNLEDQYTFVFETRLGFSLAGSSGKKILKALTKMKLKVLHSLITGIVTEQKGPLINNTLENMEEIGLKIAEILYNKNNQNEVKVFG
ncbi:MAG: flavodoxin family protein [Promethearchaeota archaeon]